MLADNDPLLFRPELNRDPHELVSRFALAEALRERGDARASVAQAGCDIHERIGKLAFPDRFDTFWTPSAGWEAVGQQLEGMAQHPEDTAVFRARYERLVRGDVPLDPDHLEETLQLQYDLQVRLLESLDLLEEEDDEQFLTAVDGKRYSLPAFEDILARLQTPSLFQEKLRQGFDTLLLVPFGLPLERFTDAWRQGLKRNATTLRSVGRFNEQEPLWVWERYRTEPLVYEPRSFTDDHGGRTKAEMVRSGRAWDVLLVEGAISNLPREGQGQTVGSRRQIACNRTPIQYLTDLRTCGESGLTPEAYVLQFMDALERGGRVLDTETYTYLTDAFLPSPRYVPSAYWDPAGGQAYLFRDVPGDRVSVIGVRAAVRVR